MQVTVLLFARLREVVGQGQVALELPDGSDTAAAYAALVTVAPGLAPMRSKVRCAVRGEYATWETVLSEGDEVALIPPTAGG
jgi:molybdopterin converting factor subunit 1